MGKNTADADPKSFRAGLRCLCIELEVYFFCTLENCRTLRLKQYIGGSSAILVSVWLEFIIRTRFLPCCSENVGTSAYVRDRACCVRCRRTVLLGFGSLVKHESSAVRLLDTPSVGIVLLRFLWRNKGGSHCGCITFVSGLSRRHPWPSSGLRPDPAHFSSSSSSWHFLSGTDSTATPAWR